MEVCTKKKCIIPILMWFECGLHMEKGIKKTDIWEGWGNEGMR